MAHAIEERCRRYVEESAPEFEHLDLDDAVQSMTDGFRSKERQDGCADDEAAAGFDLEHAVRRHLGRHRQQD